MRLSVLAALSLATVAPVLVQDGEAAFDEHVVFELGDTDTLLADRGPAHTTTHAPGFAGALHVWATSADARLVLRVESVGGALVGEDDDDGWGRSPYVLVRDVEPATVLRITVAGAEPGERGEVELHLFAAPETEATREAAAVVDDAVAESRALAASGDPAAARELLDVVLAELDGVDDSGSSLALAEAWLRLGNQAHALDAPDAAEAAWERALVHRARALPGDHDGLLVLKHRLSMARRDRGDVAGALVFQEEVLAVHRRRWGRDQPDVLDAKLRVAEMRHFLGRDLPGALELAEDFLAACVRRLAAEDARLLYAKGLVADIRSTLGDDEGARHLRRELLVVLTRVREPADPELLRVQEVLALTLAKLGDFHGARELQERVVEIRSGLDDPDELDLLRAKSRLAWTRRKLGEEASAIELQEAVVAAWTRREDPESLELLGQRWVLAQALFAAGDLEGARALQEEVLEIRTRLLGRGHPTLGAWNEDLARTRYAEGDLEAARELWAEAVQCWEGFGDRDGRGLLRAKSYLALATVGLGDADGARELVVEVLAGMGRRARGLWLESPRVAREIARDELAERLSVALLVHESAGGLGAEILGTLETVRDVTITSPRVALALGARDELVEERRAIARLKAEINDLAALGTGADVAAWRNELLVLTSERDRRQRELRSALGASGLPGGPIEAASIANALAPGSVAISYVVCPRRDPAEADAGPEPVDWLFGLLALPGGGVEVVPLASARAVGDLVRDWRAAIGKPLDTGADVTTASASELGERIRERVLDPFLARAPEARTLHVVPDGPLHLLPLDALPLGRGVVGDRYLVRTDPSLARLVHPPEESAAAPSLLVVGGVDYDADRAAASDRSLAVATPPIPPSSGLGFLTGSVEEIAAIGRLFEEWSDRPPHGLTGPGATKAALYAAAQGTRFVHIATHGWFAPEVFRSPSGADPSRRGDLARTEEAVHGLAPEVLCGLALAGANRGRDPLGRVPGVLTAEELATLDLRDCDLAVLSACDTNVGVGRAGLGIRSLQSALHAAGARTAITSLWKMDDRATRELMVELYRNLWQEGLGKADALWAAKTMLRERGYPVRAWAGWVLTGDPE